MMERRVGIAVPAPFRTALDYLAGDLEIPAGARVVVPLGRRRVVGVAVSPVREAPADGLECRPVEVLLDPEIIVPPELMHLCRWAADYYHHPIGQVLAAALPAGLRSTRPARPRRPAEERNGASPYPPGAPGPQPTAAQDQVLSGLRATPGGFVVHLIEGITGSGKTEVYLQRIADRVADGGQALVLTPEIGLTPQLVARVEQRFPGQVLSFHSGLTERQRRDHWIAAGRGQCRVLVGTRSAVFVPLPRLSLVVIDEEHDHAYKQQEGFRYSARDLAIVRAQQAGVPVILGSATPSLESLHAAESGRYRHWRLAQRATAVSLPQVQLVDLRGIPLRDGLSERLLEAIRRHTAADRQALIFVNRRGFAPALLCHACGWVATCTACTARMTLHRARRSLICHHCANAAPIPVRCPECGGLDLVPVGQGTERLESALQRHFPALPVERIDTDRMHRAGALDSTLARVARGGPAILVGTQMLAKGHDFPALTLVGVVDADGALFSADFRAVERMGQLLTQVAGRAGRGRTRGEVLVQTHHPQHPLLRHWLDAGYRGLVPELLAQRRLAGLPPFSHLALVRADARDAELPAPFLTAVAQTLLGRGVEVMGPVPAPMERRAGRYRFQLLLRCGHRPRLQRLLAEQVPIWAGLPGARRVRWSVDVDPLDLG